MAAKATPPRGAGDANTARCASAAPVRHFFTREIRPPSADRTCTSQHLLNSYLGYTMWAMNPTPTDVAGAEKPAAGRTAQEEARFPHPLYPT